MALKTFKPYTKSTRGTVVVDKSSLWKGSSYKPLTRGQHITGGRNNAGRITSRHMGGGSKHKFRIIDFFRKKKNMKASVDRIEYDPNRTAYIALITYEDKEKSYIIAPQGLKIGDTVVAGKNVEIKIGNSLDRYSFISLFGPITFPLFHACPVKCFVSIFNFSILLFVV